MTVIKVFSVRLGAWASGPHVRCTDGEHSHRTDITPGRGPSARMCSVVYRGEPIGLPIETLSLQWDDGQVFPATAGRRAGVQPTPTDTLTT